MTSKTNMSILTGEKLTKTELKQRLKEMEILFNEAIAEKQYYVNKYNEAIQQSKKTMMISFRIRNDAEDQSRKKKISLKRKKRTNEIKKEQMKLTTIILNSSGKDTSSQKKNDMRVSRFSLIKLPVNNSNVKKEDDTKPRRSISQAIVKLKQEANTEKAKDESEKELELKNVSSVKENGNESEIDNNNNQISIDKLITSNEEIDNNVQGLETRSIDSHESLIKIDSNKEGCITNKVNDSTLKLDLNENGNGNGKEIKISLVPKLNVINKGYKGLAFSFRIGTFIAGMYYSLKTYFNKRNLIGFIKYKDKNSYNQQSANSFPEIISNALQKIIEISKYVFNPQKILIACVLSNVANVGHAMFFDHLKNTLIISALLIGIYFLWKRYQNKKKIMNIFNDIKSTIKLLHDQKRDCNAGISEEEIISKYAPNNNYSDSYFKSTIMPILKSYRIKDENVKEFELYSNGKTKRYWQWSKAY